MKKVVALAALVTLAAAPAFALTIKNSKHNLASGTYSVSRTYVSSQNEICVFCHTPHAAAAVNNAPLWNRTAVTVLQNQLYNATSTLNSKPNVVFGNIASSDVPLCLSCHDGASMTDALVNPLNSYASAQPTFAAGNITTNANIGTNLTNDHPVGMRYANAVTLDGGLKSSPTFAGQDALFGGIMWCSSCHDVHDNANAPFLRTGNAGSALCLKCHNK